MIARIMGGEGQFEISDELLGRLNELDDQAAGALERNDETALRDLLEQMARLVETDGSRLPDDYLGASDLVIPPTDLTLEEARELFTEEGLIPDLPVATG
jgi:PspA-Associated protein